MGVYIPLSPQLTGTPSQLIENRRPDGPTFSELDFEKQGIPCGSVFLNRLSVSSHKKCTKERRKEREEEKKNGKKGKKKEEEKKKKKRKKREQEKEREEEEIRERERKKKKKV